MAHRARLSTWIAVALLVVGAVLVATRWRVTTALTEFAVDPADREAGRWVEQLGAGEPARTMVFTVAGADPEHARAAADALAAALVQQAEFAWVRTGPDPELGERLYAAFEPRRFRFFDREPERELAVALGDEGLAAAARHLRAQLQRPDGAATKRLAVEDPWLLFAARMHELARMREGGLALAHGHFMTPEGSAVVLAATVHGPFDAIHQAPLEDAITAAIANVRTDHDAVIERSAVHRFAVVAERSIKRELQWLSVGSSVGVLLCLWLGLGRTWRLALALLPIGAGVVVAMASTLLLYGRLHALTLAFGTTLVGVCVDYPVHWLVHRGHGARGSVWPGLLLGAGTTVIGFVALAAAGLPGLREIGIFAAAGVCGALLVTHGVVAPLGSRAAATRSGVLARLPVLVRRRAAVHVVVLVLAGLAAVGLLRARWVDDARALAPAPSEIVDEDARVRARVDRTDVSRMLVAQGADFEAAAQVQDQLWLALRDRDLLDAPRWCAPLVWSTRLQERNLATVRASVDLPARMAAALAAAGFRPEAFAAWSQALADDPGPLDEAVLREAGLASLLDPFVVRGQGSVGLVAFMPAAIDDATLDEVAAAVPGVVVFDQARFVASLYRRHREGTLLAFAFGMAGIVLLLGFRHRRAQLVIRALAPACVGAVAALGAAAWSGTPLQLMHLVGCLLVVSMGVDYGVFVVEGAHDETDLTAARSSIAIAAITTVLSFALLGLSSAPALAALGRTVALGVSIAALLALTLATAAPTRGRAPR